MRIRTFAAVLAGMIALCPALGEEHILLNGGMELGLGAGAPDPMVAASWTEFGINVERSATMNAVPTGSGHALKAFGDSDSSAAGASQEISNILAGQSVRASVQLATPSFDKLGGTGEAGLVIEFLNMFGGTIGSPYEVYPLKASSDADTWVAAELGPYTAPSGTSKVRVSCKLKWGASVYGAAYWDDARVIVGTGSNLVVNSDFETAGASGQSPFGIDDWTGFNDQEQSTDAARDGTHSVKIGTREQYSGLWQNMTAVAGGDHLVLTAYVWNPSAAPLTGTSRAGIKLEFSPNAATPTPVENLAFDANEPVDTWTPVTVVATVPDEVTVARAVCILVADAATTGAVHFDTVYAERSSDPGVNQLANTSFEDGFGGPNGIDSWNEFGSDTSVTRKSCFTVPAVDGICTARATGTGVTGITQEFPVTPGEEVTITGYLFSSSTEPLTGGARAGMKVEWVFGTVPDPVDIGPPGSPNTIGAGAATDTWLPLTIDYTMPEGTAAVPRFVCIVEKGSGLTGRVYFDSCDVVVTNWVSGCAGDYNCDGARDFDDIKYLVAALGGEAAWSAYHVSHLGVPPTCDYIANCDADGNGAVDFDDIKPFVRLIGVPCGS